MLAAPAELRGHHARVALPAGHQRGRPRDAAHRRDRDRRRDPRGGPRQARRAPRAHARAARSAVRRPAAAASGSRRRSGRSRPSRGCSSATGRCRRSSTPATSATSTSRSCSPTASSRRSRRPSRWPTCSTRSRRWCSEHRTTLVFVNTRRLAERLAHQLGERLGDEVVAAHHGSLSKDRRHRVETPPPGGRPAGARRDRVARARHRHRAGRARVPDRLAAQHRHLPAARRPLEPHPGRHAEGPPLPADARRARRVRGAARRGARPAASTRSCRHGSRSTSLAQHVSPRPRRRSGAPTTSTRSCATAAPYNDLTREQFDEVVDARLATASRPAAGGAARTSTTTRSTASCAARNGASPRRAHLRRRDPRDRRLPRRRRARRHLHRHGQRGLGRRVDGGRHLPARHALVADPPGRARGGARARRAATPRRPSRSGWARRRPAPPSCRPRSRTCGAASTSCSLPATPTARAGTWSRCSRGRATRPRR